MNRTKTPKRKKAVDFTLFLATILLVLIGIIMVFSSSWPEAMVKYNNGYLFLRKQLTAALIGLVALLICMNFNYKYYKKLAVPIYLVTIILGLLIFSPLGAEYKGARRWLEIGPLSFMPSDVIKIGSIIFFATFLSNKKERLGSVVHGTIPALVYIGISSGLIYLQRDLGTTITMAGTMMGMFFIAGMNLLHLIPLGLGIIPLGIKAVSGPDNAYRLKRITTFRNPFEDLLYTGWQAAQSLYALGSGGLFGLGLGKSRQKFFYIPESYNDFIFSIIGEELGFLGSVTVIFLFLLVIWRGIRIALNTEDAFGCFLATGIVALITVQSLINIAVVTSSLPTTGITLPFISYGGTSLIIYMAAVGILLNISRHSELDRN